MLDSNLFWLIVAMLVVGETIGGTFIVQTMRRRGAPPSQILSVVLALVGGVVLFVVTMLYAVGVR